MKIVMFGHKRIPSREGGVEIVVEELGSRMAALGHEVICYNRGGHGTTQKKLWRGIQLRRVPTVDRKGLAAVTSSFFAALSAAFREADVVHIHGEGPAFWCFLPKLAGKRVIVTVHGLDWQREKWKDSFGAKYICWGENMAVRFADGIIVLSRNVRDYFEKTYGRSTVYIPNGVNVPDRLPVGRIWDKYGLAKDGYLLFLGRLVPEKGVHCLIEAFRAVKTDKKLVIAGGSSDSDEYVRRLKAMAEGDGRILFTGFVEGQVLEELYSNAWVYVLPSGLEGMPLSLLEAMSYGNCCLVSDIPECREVVEDKGMVFPAGNGKALTEKLQKLCENAALVAAYRKDAREYICGKYNWDDVTRRTLELYR